MDGEISSIIAVGHAAIHPMARWPGGARVKGWRARGRAGWAPPTRDTLREPPWFVIVVATEDRALSFRSRYVVVTMLMGSAEKRFWTPTSSGPASVGCCFHTPPRVCSALVLWWLALAPSSLLSRYVSLSHRTICTAVWLGVFRFLFAWVVEICEF